MIIEIYNANIIKNKVYYYRLKMIDLDGSVNFSEVVSAVVGDENFKPYKIYPNPVDDQLSMNFMILDQEKPMIIEIYNAIGTLVYKDEISRETGENLIQLELDYLSSGFYFLHVKHDAYIFSEPLIKR